MNYKMGIFLFFALVFSHSICFSDNGDIKGSGGSVIKEANGNYLLADSLFKMVQNPERQYDPQNVVDIPNQFPAAWKEYSNIVALISRRSNIFSREDKTPHIALKNFQKPATWYESVAGFKVYWTSKLAGSDLMLVSGKKTTQAAFTYQTKVRVNSAWILQKIVELDRSIFEKLSARSQALLLLHEVLHHIPDTNHNFIAQVIQAVDVALNVLERQKDKQSNLSANEYKVLVDFQKNICALNYGLAETSEACSENYDNFYVNKHGGGLINGDVSENNYISFNSVLSIEGQANGQLNFTNNTIMNSNFRIKLSGKCDSNYFDQVFNSIIECKNSSQNRVENICAWYLDSMGCKMSLLGEKIQLKRVMAQNLVLDGHNKIDNLIFFGEELRLNTNINISNAHISIFSSNTYSDYKAGYHRICFKSAQPSILKNLYFRIQINDEMALKLAETTDPNVIIQIESSALDFGGPEKDIKRDSYDKLDFGSRRREINLDTLTHATFNFSDKNFVKIKSVSQFDKDYVE